MNLQLDDDAVKELYVAFEALSAHEELKGEVLHVQQLIANAYAQIATVKLECTVVEARETLQFINTFISAINDKSAYLKVATVRDKLKTICENFI